MKNYIKELVDWLDIGYELSVEEYVYTSSDELDDYFDKYASVYLTGEFEDRVLNFPTTDDIINDCPDEARMRIAKMTWEELEVE